MSAVAPTSSPVVKAECLTPTGRVECGRLPGVATHDASQRRVGLQRRRIDPDGLALDQIRRRQDLQDPREDGAMRLDLDQAPGARDRRVLRHRLVEPQAQEAAEGQRIGAAPRDPAFRIDPLEVADQQQPEVRTGREARSPERGRIERRALAAALP